MLMIVRVLCVGHVNWDVTLRVEALPSPDGEARVHERRESCGGSAANCASALATLGVETGVFGSVGADPQGRQSRRELVDAGVAVAGLVEADVGTARKYLAVDPGRRAGERAFGPVLAAADYLFLTADEARQVGIDPEDPTDRGDWTDESARRERVVLMKDGPDGARLRSPVGAVAHGGFDVDPRDTTGAGDAFAAGFLAAVLTDWRPVPGQGLVPDGAVAERYRRALVVADACGAITARRAGARVHLSRGEVERFLGEQA